MKHTKQHILFKCFRNNVQTQKNAGLLVKEDTLNQTSLNPFEWTMCLFVLVPGVHVPLNLVRKQICFYVSNPPASKEDLYMAP